MRTRLGQISIGQPPRLGQRSPELRTAAVCYNPPRSAARARRIVGLHGLDLLFTYPPWTRGHRRPLLRLPEVRPPPEDPRPRRRHDPGRRARQGPGLGLRPGQARQGRQQAQEAGELARRGKLLEDADPHAGGGRGLPRGPGVLGGRRHLREAGQGRKGGRAVPAGRATTRRRPQLLIDAGKPGKAAVLFQEKGNNLEAARLFGLAGQWDKAAELYAKSGYPLRAAEAFEKQGAVREGGRGLREALHENVSYSTTYSSSGQTGDQKSALLAGRLYEKAGDLNRAYQVYTRGELLQGGGGAPS